MTIPPLSSETLHVSCVAKDGRGILISGRSGSGKSDLALRLIDRGAVLVSDDYTVLRRVEGRLLASAPPNIQGKIEVRGIGILQFETVSDVPVCLFVDLDRDVERLPPERETMRLAGVAVPVIAANALEASAPVKVEAALHHFGTALS
ncbi:MAG TPA: HPr kinase/phosphatase C-terminal domain-containing protein [Allosphingosinicella sp.]|nr:HPr kinase/phosphatase C-terminal domain-containing protein [Allosphingosinicella sp.]